MNLIIYDFEVFRFDTLLGYGIVNQQDGTCQWYQTWNLEEMREIYNRYADDSIWIGWNNNFYDDVIFETIIRNKVSPYVKSKELINSKYRQHCRIKLYAYDLLNGFLNPPSLKLTEALEGDSIDTTEVDFDIQRALTPEEMKLTESYNMSDLKRTFKNFCKFKGTFELRLSMISEFGIPLQAGLTMTGTQVAAAALNATRKAGIENMKIIPELPKTLKLNNQELIDWFLNEKFRTGETLSIDICNSNVTIAAGGAHSVKNKYHCKKAIYADISGYYNLIMMNFDLLPRTLDDRGKERYAFMYHEQLRLKKIDPAKRSIYKTVCLSVFGAMNNEHTDFYDPQKALLVTTTGEIFMMDLLEKLDGLGTAFNVNTDGIMFEPFDWNDQDKIFGIINEWVERNGFTVKTGIITDYHGRDVNCYIMYEPDGSLCVKGEAVKNYDIGDKAFARGSFFNCKEPPIIAQGIVNAFMNGVLPEEFVEQNKTNYKLFQYVAKKNSYDYLEYVRTSLKDGSKSAERVQSPSRCFAANLQNSTGTIVKHRTRQNKHQTAKVQNLPESCIIYNGALDTCDLSHQIDYGYYIKRIYQRIAEFLL